MRNICLSLTLVMLLGTMYSPAYGVDSPSQYVTHIPNCKINMLTKASCNTKGSLCIGLTTIGGCEAGDLSKQETIIK